MLKATAGGRGVGLMVCNSEKEVRQSFAMIESRGEAFFKNSGVFMERFYPSSRIYRGANFRQRPWPGYSLW